MECYAKNTMQSISMKVSEKHHRNTRSPTVCEYRQFDSNCTIRFVCISISYFSLVFFDCQYTNGSKKIEKKEKKKLWSNCKIKARICVVGNDEKIESICYVRLAMSVTLNQHDVDLDL